MKNPNLKITPLSLALLGGISLVSGAAQAANSVKETREVNGDTQTYTITASDTEAGEHFILNNHIVDAPGKVIVNIDDSTLEAVKLTSDRSTYSALGFNLEVDTTNFTDNSPVNLEVNLKHLKSSYTTDKILSNSAVFVNGSIPNAMPARDPNATAKVVPINIKTTVTGDEERLLHAYFDNVNDDNRVSYSEAALSNIYSAPGTHRAVFDAPNTTYKATVGDSTHFYITSGLNESVEHYNSHLDVDFNRGHIVVEGGYSAKGIKTSSLSYNRSRQAETTPTVVNVTVNGGTINVTSSSNSRDSTGVANDVLNNIAGILSTTINGGEINVTSGQDGNEVDGVRTVINSNKNLSGLEGAYALTTQNGGTINVDAAKVKIGSNVNSLAYGLYSNTEKSPVLKAKVVQNGGVLHLTNTGESANVAAALASVSGQDAEIVQGANATSTVTGVNNAVAVAKSKHENVLVDLAGHGEATTYGIYTKTAADKLSTINIRGTAQLFADTAVYNNEGNSNITVEEGATIGKADQKTKFDLGLGDDKLILNNVNLDNISELDGGQDADVTTDFDTLVLDKDPSLDTELNTKLTNWERIELKRGDYSLRRDLSIGHGVNGDKVGGIEVAEGAKLYASGNAIGNPGETINITGDIINKGLTDLSRTTLTGDVFNKKNEMQLYGANISGKLTNEGEILVVGATVKGGIHNKANGSIRVGPFIGDTRLDADIDNEGQVGFGHQAYYHGNIHNRASGTVSIRGINTFVDGEINNEGVLNSSAHVNPLVNKHLNVNNTGTVNIEGGRFKGTINNDNLLNIEDNLELDGTINQNKGAQNLYLKNIRIQDNNGLGKGYLNNKGLVTVVGNASVSNVNNKVGGTLVVNSGAVLDSILSNEGTLTLENGSIVKTEVNNKSGAQANLNQAKIIGTLNNESTLTLEDGFTLEGHFNNKANGIATLNQATITERVTNEGNLTVASNLNLGKGLYNKEGGLANINSNFTGYFSNEGRAIASNDTFSADVRNAGTLSFNGDAKILGNLSNTNLLDLRNATPDHFNTLTVEGDLAGDGLIKFNAKIAGDSNTLHDTLHVKGNVHGTTTVEITNLGEAKDARELKRGVRIVELEDSSVVDQGQDAFKLLATVEAGAYEYNKLAYKTTAGNKGFYLVSKPTATSGTEQRGDDSTIIDKDGNPVYLFRKGTAAYILNQQINAQALANLTTNLHQRSGEQRAETNYLNKNQSWVRYLGNQDELTAHNLGAKTTNFGVQVGYDFRTTHNHENGLRNRTGIYAAYNKVDSTITDSYRKEFYIPGRIDTSLGSLALYHTATLGNSYLDLVGGLHFFHSDYAIINGGEQNAFGGNLSAEAGYNLDLGNHFFVEPQVQLSYQGTRYVGFKDVVTAVKGYTHQSLRPRAGFRLGYHDLAGTNLWLHANLETELLKTAKLVIGQDIVSINRAAKTVYDLGLNGQVALTPTSVLYGSVQYRGSINKATTLKSGAKVKTTKLQGFGAEAGLRFTW